MTKNSMKLSAVLVALLLANGAAHADGHRTTDHRETSERQNETVPAERGEERPNETVPARRGERRNETVPAQRADLDAPSDLVLWRVGQTDLTLIWMDNAHFEDGVEVERGQPTRERGGVNYHWERIFNSEERVISRSEGAGMRTDMDDGLEPNTQYCYRLRAYRGDQVSEYSEPECVRTQE